MSSHLSAVVQNVYQLKSFGDSTLSSSKLGKQEITLILVAIHFLTIRCRQILHTGSLKEMASLHCDLGPLSVIVKEYLKCVSSQYLLLLLWVLTSLVIQGVFL